MGRYPHYSLRAVLDDLERLERAGWLEPVPGRDAWNLAAAGRELVDGYFELEAERTSGLPERDEAALAVVLSVLEAVSAEASSAGDGGYNESIRWRREGPRAPDAAPAMVRALQAFRDLVAFVNDNAHYRFQRRARESGESAPALGPLARELLAAMREGREYPASHCAEQPRWRVGLASCRAAMAELAGAGMAESVVGEVFRQTEAGARYFAEAEAMTDLRLYRSWLVVSEPDYEAFLHALDLLEEATPRP
jgi:hypothetical protein